MSPEIIDLILSLQSVKHKTLQSLLNVLGCSIELTTNVEFFHRLIEFRRILHGNRGLYAKSARTPSIKEYVISYGHNATQSDCRAVAQAIRSLYSTEFLSKLFNIAQPDCSINCMIIDNKVHYIKFDSMFVTPGHSIINPNTDKIIVPNFYSLEVYNQYIVFITYTSHLWHEALSHFNAKSHIVESLGALLGIPYTYNIYQFYQRLKIFLQMYNLEISVLPDYDNVLDAIRKHSALNNLEMNIKLVAKLLREILQSVEFMSILEQNYQSFNSYLKINSSTQKYVIQQPVESITITPIRIRVTYESGVILELSNYEKISYSINVNF